MFDCHLVPKTLSINVEEFHSWHVLDELEGRVVSGVGFVV